MGLSDPSGRGHPKSRVPGRLAGGLLLSVAVYYAVWGGEYSALDLRRLAREKAAEEVELAEARRGVDSLRALAKRLESDPATIEQVARERFGMIRDGEVLYRFVEVAPAPRRTVSRQAP